MLALSAALDEIAEATRAALLPLGLSALPLPEEAATAHGALGDRAITLRSQCFLGDGPLRALRIARGVGAMESLTVLALPSRAGRRPVLAFDLVAFQGAESPAPTIAVAFLDRCPLVDGPVPARTAPLTAALAAFDGAFSARELPAFCAGVVSPDVRFARDERRAPEAPGALAALAKAQVAAFLEDLRGEAAPGDGAAPQEDFLHRMRENKREARALARLFGASWAERYLNAIFFGP